MAFSGFANAGKGLHEGFPLLEYAIFVLHVVDVPSRGLRVKVGDFHYSVGGRVFDPSTLLRTSLTELGTRSIPSGASGQA